MNRAMIWIALGLSLWASGPAYATELATVQIPLDRTDGRFGHFYVKSLDAYLYRPNSNDPAPTIVFLHGCGGLWGNGLASGREYATHFATLGYATLLLDFSDPRQLGERPCKDGNLNDALLPVRSADLDAAVAWLVKNKVAIPEKIAALGTSHGAKSFFTTRRAMGVRRS